jgi:excisionase family DNA binding protein
MSEKKQGKKLISIREAAKECGRNTETVRRWIWAGKLPAEKLGNQLFIKKGDLASYCRETAIQYRAEVEPDFANTLKPLQKRQDTTKLLSPAKEIHRMREDRMYQIGSKEQFSESGIFPGSRAKLIVKMRILKEEIRARVGNLDAEDTIAQLRNERTNELTNMR